MASVRPAVAAGMFYPGDARSLGAEVDDLLGRVERLLPRFSYPRALIVPHAGYIYSGAVAASAYDELAAARGIVKRVVMLGPAHRMSVRGLATSSADAFATPLGAVPIDREALHVLEHMPQVVRSDPVHALEHSLEVQLPFLQKVLGDFALVPLAVGTAGVEEVAAVIEQLWGAAETLMVISTDLSHYHPYAEARTIDRATITRIAGFATDLNHEEACGATPLNGLLQVSKKKNLSIKLLAACNSGDTAGGKGQVVGYSAFALNQERDVSHEQAGKTLLGIAAGAIAYELGLGPRPALDEAAWLAHAGATFVTLTRDGALRGCIGSLEAVRPLGSDVAENALAAAFRDPRFPALTREEWPHCRVEVSLLSAPKPLRFADEEELLAQLRPGIDGLILEADGRRGTFLPQVWEGIADRRVFVKELMKKAGLKDDTRVARCKVSRYRVVKWIQGSN
jgi:AmmeMemoRadiSam system protein B/AmmeMemoRadiSam system protein A